MYTRGVPGSVHESVLDAIGATPLIRLRRVTEGLAPAIYVKAEWQNAGGSVKDRAALWMIRAAERSGALRPGGVIVEGTSGNTGIGLALVGGFLGYRTLIVVPDTTAAEKIAALRAYGAEVVLTPGGLPRDDPRHVINLAARIAQETPGGWLADQYGNPANPQAHHDTTAPEIWEQTGGRVTCFVAGIGTGGTLSGTGAALKERGPVRVVGVDPVTSAYGGGDGSPYYVEAIGHYRHPDTVDDPWPANWDRVRRRRDRARRRPHDDAHRPPPGPRGGAAARGLVGDGRGGGAACGPRPGSRRRRRRDRARLRAGVPLEVLRRRLAATAGVPRRAGRGRPGAAGGRPAGVEVPVVRASWTVARARAALAGTPGPAPGDPRPARRARRPRRRSSAR